MNHNTDTILLNLFHECMIHEHEDIYYIADDTNLALGKITRVISPETSLNTNNVVTVPSLAVDGHLGQTLKVDGDLSGRCLRLLIANPWFLLDLGDRKYITRIVVYFRDSNSK